MLCCSGWHTCVGDCGIAKPFSDWSKYWYSLWDAVARPSHRTTSATSSYCWMQASGKSAFLVNQSFPRNSRKTKLAAFLAVLLLPMGYWLSLMSLIDFLGAAEACLQAQKHKHINGHIWGVICAVTWAGVFVHVVVFCSNWRLDSAAVDDFKTHILPQSHQEIIPLTTGE